MTIYTLSHGPLKLDVSDRGGVIEGFWRDATPLLRPGKKSGVATDASCFPLVPFANRVSGNRFVWQGREYQLQPNVEWDAHYLHGDGWLGQWQCVSRSEDSLCLVYEHRSGVYHYRVSQAFHLTADTLTVTLSVTNQGAETLPFGTGWHPYFPLSPQTRIQAQASGYWLEREQWLAGEFCEQLPQELDFNQLAPLPRQWVNNGFAGWNGQSRIEQPQEGYAIIMETTPPAPCYFIFVSDPAFDKGYAFDFFCLEPMSHAPDDHHRPEGGDLIALAASSRPIVPAPTITTDRSGCRTSLSLAASSAWRRVKQRSPSASSNGSGRAAAPVAINS